MPRLKIHACRVCACTDDNACEGGCSWVRVEPNGPPLCSECDGTEGDVIEATRRIASLSRRGGGFEVVYEAARIARALSKRVKVRSIRGNRWGPF